MTWLTVAVLSSVGLPAFLAVALAVLLATAGSRARRFAGWIAAIGPVVVLGTGIAAAGRVLTHVSGPRPPAPWVGAVVSRGSLPFLGPGLSVGWSVDGLSALMLVIVGFVALMVVVFSLGYMADDRGYVRYFALLSLFTSAMTLLVVSDGLLGIFIGWELVGACSFLLIGFWFDKPSAVAAALKAFLVTRLGDVGFLIGLAILWRSTGTLSLTGVVAALGHLPAAVITTCALLLFAGAAGKSAQFPLHVWLPDAMAGPTPVSALIHAATMVAAGVFLIVRVWPLYAAAPAARTVILVLAVITALGGAIAAVPQRDIKKVLAYSTISQLGFMFAALGAGAFPAAIFHLTAHAAFKALLFLGAGSVIHATGTQDLAEMGGLARRMPLTFVAWLAGAAALAGIPPLSGFFSKDEIIGRVLSASPLAGALLLVAAFLTALYATRVTMLAFFGAPRGTGLVHESPAVMTLPLLGLAVPALFAGLAAGPVAGLLGEPAAQLSLATAAGSAAVALAGAATGWALWRGGPAVDAALEARAPRTWALACSAFLVDAVFVATASWVVAFAGRLYEDVDSRIIDAAVEGVVVLARRTGATLTRLQSGQARRYAMLVAATAVAVAALWWSR